MPKSLGLDIVIGASVGAALKSIDLVTNSTKVLGTAIEKLNSCLLYTSPSPRD